MVRHGVRATLPSSSSMATSPARSGIEFAVAAASQRHTRDRQSTGAAAGEERPAAGRAGLQPIIRCSSTRLDMLAALDELHVPFLSSRDPFDRWHHRGTHAADAAAALRQGVLRSIR